MQTNNCGNKLKPSKSYRDSEDAAAKEVVGNESEFKSKVFYSEEKKRPIDSPGFIRSSSHSNSASSFHTIVVCQRDSKPLGRSRGRARDDFRMARGGSVVERRGGGGNGIGGSSISMRGRGSGGMSRKVVEREIEPGVGGFIPRGKFQESLSKGGSGDVLSSSSSKNANETEGNKNRIDCFFMLPEDTRISKLLRRLNREDDPEKAISITKQLQEAFQNSENGRYIRRSVDIIADSLLEVLRRGPGSDARLQAARCLGRLGYALESDFKRFSEWLFSKYSSERGEEVRRLLMVALLETLKVDARTGSGGSVSETKGEGSLVKLKDFSAHLMAQLQTALENTCLPDLLIATVDVLLFLAKLSPDSFTKHFRDTVDILVGWHIDGGQPHWVSTYASQTLRKFRPFWLADLGFSVNLLAQFIEDVEAFGEDLLQSESGRSSPEDKPPSSPEDHVFRITQLIKVFNTVVRSLGSGLTPAVPPTPPSPVTWPFLVDGLQKVLKAVHAALSTPISSHQNYEDLIVSANECVCLLLSLLHSKMGTSVLEALKTFLLSQISLTPTLSHIARVSMLSTIAKTVREVSSNLPPELVPALISPVPSNASPLLPLRFGARCPGNNDCPCRNTNTDKKGIGGEGEMLLVVHHALLSLKNVPLLQEAYRYVLIELEDAYTKLVPSATLLSNSSASTSDARSNDGESDGDQLERAQIIVIYQLRAISDLANASNSIIGMWALQPSILELLAVRMQPSNQRLSVNWPYVQNAILYLLRSHCQRYNHFVSSSGLVAPGSGGSVIGGPTEVGGLVVPSGSPTSGNLSIILQLLTKLLNEPETGEPTRLLVLSWCQELITHCSPYLHGKNGSVWRGQGTEFSDFLWALVSSGRTHKRAIAQAVLLALSTLLEANTSFVKSSGENWCFKVLPPEMVPVIVDLCVQHLDWPEPESLSLQPLLLRILPCLPWPIALPTLLSRLTASAPSLVAHLNDVGAVTHVLPISQRESNMLRANEQKAGSRDVPLSKLIKSEAKCARMSTVVTWRSIMCDAASRGTFGGEMHPTHFRPFMAYLLHGTQHSDKNWLSQSFASCWPLQHGQGSFEGNLRNNIVAALTGKKGVEGKLEDQSMALELALSSEATLLSWAAHQAAQLCVRMKLRTPLGKPQDTFTSIESAIKNIAREGPQLLIQLSKSDSEESVLALGGGIAKWLARTQPIARRAMVLLEFLEQLEKAAYNAWEGSAVSMPPPPKPVRTFFRTNKSTCAEWLGRIRWASMTVAVQRTTHGAPAHALRHGQMMLTALAETSNMKSSEFERSILHVAWSLCMLGEPEAIVGLQAWCTSMASVIGSDDGFTGARFSWLKAISYQAAGRYEAALKEYMTVLEEDVCTDCDENKSEHIDPHVMAFIHKQIEECYCSLQAWDAAVLWHEKDSQKVENHYGWLFERKSASILQALSDFPSSIKDASSEDKLVTEVEKDGGTSDDEVETLWEKYGFKECNVSSASSTVSKVESILQSVALTLANGGSKITDALKLSIKEEVEGCEKALQIHLRESLFSNPANFIPEACILQYAASGLRSTLEGKSGNFLFDLSESDTLDPGLGSALLGKLLWWSHFFSANVENERVISRLRLCGARAARWEGNFKLCEQLLEKEIKAHSDKEVFAVDNFQVISERAKFLHHTGKQLDAINLAAKTCLEVCKALSNQLNTNNNAVQERCSRLLISLSKWIHPIPTASIIATSDLNDSTGVINSNASALLCGSITDSSSLVELLEWEKTIPVSSLGMTPPGFEEIAVSSAWENGKMSDSATALPRLIRLGVTTCPQLAKAWASLGGWCYDMGRKTVEEISMPATAGGNNIPMWLSEEELLKAQNIFAPLLLTNQEIIETCEFLTQRMTEEDSEFRDVFSSLCSDLAALSFEVEDQQHVDEGANTISEQENTEVLASKKHLSSLSEQKLSELWELVQEALKRRYVHYEMAVGAYFRYLHLSGGNEDVKDKDSAVSADSTTRLMASLRLLRLVSSPLRAHVRLRPYLEHGVASTPVAPWIPLLPQLLSRLGHASTPPYARRALSGLLCRLPQHLVAFPAVVGATADSLTKGSGLRQPSGPKTSIHRKNNSLRESRDETASGMFDSSLSESGEGQETEEVDEEEKVEESEENKVVEREGEEVEEEEEEEEEEDDEDEEESGVGEVQASVMKNCFQSIVDTLAKKNPECVAGVQTLVKELRRTTLLWDEAWTGLLVQQSTEAARRCSQAEAEAARTYANSGITDPATRDRLVMEKHRIIVAPVLWALEQLYSLTCTVPPETPHERRFRDRHGPLLTELLSCMRQPPDPRHPNESWMSLYVRIQASLRGGSNSGPPSLRMSEVSPVLAAMRGTAVAMPGANISTGNVVTIEAVHEHITILPTKTRPKKLVFHGSDGQKYTYLFKGLEDLHLDERIMQFLSVANTMMARASRTCSNMDMLGRGGSGWKSRGSLYRARHYSVTPLGPRAGLISWVEGATPLFGLYKRWQHRQAAAAAAAAAALAAKPSGNQSTSGSVSSSKSGGSTTGAPTGILRPSELFHSKLAPLLKERGIPVPVAPGPHGGGGYVPADGRREWPPQVLRQVLTQLMEETPKDLLAKELWCRSANASSWWQTTRTYAHSVAVMSIIGYVIGLGDRHLDNVLVDLETGEVVHIDYNVCFEKGRTLRVPEKVPFRMTPNLETALGVTGVEGTFRLACEQVLQTLQNGSETLLTLLEAFVYDPLVDWTPGNEAGYAGSVYGGGWSHRRPQASALEGRQSRKEMEKELTKSMFIVRVEEMKTEWFSNQDDLKDLLPQAKVQLEAWEAARSAYRSRARTLQGWHHVLAALKDAEANCMLLAPATEDVENKEIDINASGDGSSNQGKPLMVNGAVVGTSGDGEDIVEHAKKGLMEAIQEWEAQEELHQAALSSLFGPQLSMWIQEVRNFPLEEREGDESRESFDLVRGLLQSLGAGPMVAQCDQSRTDLWTVRCRRQMLEHGCLDLLGQYATLASFFPRSNSKANPHRPTCYARWANELLQEFTIERCRHLHSVATSLLLDTSNVSADYAAVVNYRSSLHSSINRTASRLENVCVRLRAEKLDEADGNLTMLPLQACEESRGAIVRFITAEGGLLRGGASIQCVVLTALAGLNRQFLSMETAAASAGEALSVLCSREGDWFLEEMCHVITTVTEIASIVEMDEAWGREIGNIGITANAGDDIPQLRDALHCLHTAYGIFKGLQDLNFNVRTIILPEALKSVIGEEPSVRMMMDLLDILERNLGADLVHHFGPDVDPSRSPTKRLLNVLQTHLQFVAIGAESPHAAAPAIAERLCRQFEEVLRNDEDGVRSKRDPEGGLVSHGNMSPGQMLLMGFNGLFEKVQREGCALAESLPSIIPPRAWVDSIDHLIESEALLAPMLRPETRDTQETLLHVQRVHAIREFFSLCQRAADAFRSEDVVAGSELDDEEEEEEQICSPVKVFTAHAVQGLLLGAVTRSISMAVCIVIQKALGINVNETIKDLSAGSGDNFSCPSKSVSLEDLCRRCVEVCCQRDAQGLQPSTPTQLSSSPLLSPHNMLTMPIRPSVTDSSSSSIIPTSCLTGVTSSNVLPLGSGNVESVSHHELSPSPADPAVLLAFPSEGHTNSSIINSALPAFPTIPNDSEIGLSHSRTPEEISASRGDTMGLFSVLPVSSVMTKRVVPLLPSFPLNLLHVASALLCTFQSHCNRLALQRRLLRDAEWNRSSLQRMRLQAAAHAWLHGSEDDGIESQRDSMSVNILSRPEFLNELRECVSALSAVEPRVIEASENYSSASKSAIQRLKWEQDSNPAIGEVVSAFEKELSNSLGELTREGSLSALLSSVGATLLHREGLRSGCRPMAPEAEAADSAFLRILNECQTSLTAQQQKLMKITSSVALTKSTMKPDMAALCKITDPSLLQVTPDSFTDTNSIRTFEVHIAERIRGVQVEMGEAQVAMEAADDGVRRCATKIRSLLATHHRLMSDVRSLLKAMLKFEEMVSSGLDAFLRLYRSYSESFASLLRTLLAPPGTLPLQDSSAPSAVEEGLPAGGTSSRAEDEGGSDGEDGEMMGGRADARRKRHALEQLHSLEAMTGQIYNGLVDLAANMAQAASGIMVGDLTQQKRRQSGRPKLVRQDGICQSPAKTPVPVGTTGTSPRGVKGGLNSMGERNAYALSVWKRVKMKLEGKDPNPSKRSSVAEQVDYVIREATSLDNLSLLYEGWTPWV